MSWKTDKFQALRDRAMNTKAGCAQVEAAMARSAQIRAVTASLRPEPASRHDDDLAGTLTLDKLSRAKAQLTANEINARTRSTELHIQGVVAKLRAEAGEAKALAEITRELRGEPEPDPWDKVLDMATMADKGMRYAYGLNVAHPSSVVAVSGI